MRHLRPDEIQRYAEVRRASSPSGDGAEAHLASCAHCRGEVDALRTLIARIEGLGRHGPADGFAEDVARRVDVAAAVVDHELARLRGWSPAPGFASAVLARVRLPVPWPERLMRFVRRRRAALATSGAATLCVSGAATAWLLGGGGGGPVQLVALATAGARALLMDALLAVGRVGYRLGLVDAGGSILDRISPAAALASLALAGLVGTASLWTMASLLRRPACQPVRIRRSAAVGVLAAACLACVSGTAPASAQEVEIADAAITLSASGRAELWFELEDGTEHRLRFEDREIELDGESIGWFEDGGPLASGWRDFLRGHAGEDVAGIREGLIGFTALLGQRAGAGDAVDRDAAGTLELRLREILEPARAQPAADAEGPEAGFSPGSLQIVPGGLGFDVGGRLERLRDALNRLGAPGSSIDDGLTLIVHGDYRIPTGRTIGGDIAILDGTLNLAGDVRGDILLLDGGLVLDDGARVEGDVLRVGGEFVSRGASVTIGGEILSDVALAPEAPAEGVSPAASPVVGTAASPAPRRNARPGPWSRITRNFGIAAEGLIQIVFTFIILAVLGLLFVRFARARIETVADTVRRDFARAFAMGIAGQVLFVPALLILVVLVVTWLVLPFFVFAAGIAGLAGYVAVAHGAGEMFARRRHRYAWLERVRRSNSYYYVTSGLVLLMLPFALGAALWIFGGAAAFVRGLLFATAGLGTWVLITAGFGGVLLTRGGERSVVVDWPGGTGPDGAAPPAGEAGSPPGPDA